MVEPVTTAVVAGFFGNWAASKLTDDFWRRLEGHFRHDVLVKQIETQLRGDAFIQETYASVPTLDRKRLTTERIGGLLKATVASDVESLKTFLMEEQLITLPTHTTTAPKCFDDVWRSVAHAVVRAVEAAIIYDDELCRWFLLAVARLDHVSRSRIEASVEALRQDVQGIADLIVTRQASGASGDSVTFTHAAVIAEQSAARAINLLTEENEQLEHQLRERLDEKTEQLWEQVLQEIQQHNFRLAIAKGEELHSWLNEQAAKLSDDARGRAYLLLAQVALLESFQAGDLDGEFAKARQLFETARSEFGEDVAEENCLRLLSFEAKLLAIDGKESEAIALLGRAIDHHSVTTHLLIQIDANAFDAAATFVRELSPSEKWCDHAVFVFARSNAMEDAERTLTWAIDHGDPLIEQRCRVAFARGVLMRINEIHEETAFSILSTTPVEHVAIEAAFSKVHPIVDVCTLRGDVETGLEADGVSLAYTCCRLLPGRLDEAREYIQLLRAARPVNLEFARAVFRDDVAAPDDLIDCIRSDYPNDFEALDLTVALGVRNGCSPTEVLDQVEAMEHLAQTQEQRDKLGRSIIQACTASSVELHARANAMAERIVGNEHRAYQLLKAHEHLLNSDFESCEQILDGQAEEDHLAGQFRAQLLLKQGQRGEAAETLLAIGQRMSEPDILKEAARLAFDADPRRIDIVVQALEDALVLQPRDLVANHNLAFAYVDLHVFAKAAECLARLRELEPRKVEHALNHAKCLELSNRPGEALPIYDDVCSREGVPLRAHLMRSSLLSDLGKPSQGFQALLRIRDTHWEDYGFVLHYIETAYKANEDRLAFEGFEQLWKLRESGRAPADVLQPRPLEDFAKFRHAERERLNFLHDQVLVGKLPWLFVERLLGTVPYLGWRARTQPSAWVFDDPRNRVSLSIYATNGYGVLLAKDGGKTLERIECPEKSTPIVADLSALITLHRLGLLAEAIEFFGSVKIPASYLSEVLQHSGRLQPHQLSQKTSLERIRVAIEQKLVHVVTDVSDALFVNEYADDEPTYRLQDILQTLETAGRLTAEQMKLAGRAAKKLARRDAGGKLMSLADHLVVDLATLKTIVEEDIFDPLCNAFDRVSVLASDQERGTAELQSFETAAETQGWHDDLWSTLTNDDRVDHSTPIIRLAESDDAADPSDSDDGDTDEDEATGQDRITAIDATLLAQQENLPLLADDRICQNMAFVANGRDATAAFGTDILLNDFHEHDVIEKHKAAAAFLRLVEWRYRFIVVPASVLRTLFDQFSAHDLRRVAIYVHDCMRDPGLFGGQETTDPPMPIAFRFYQDWLKEIATFLANVWIDLSVSEDRAVELTRWATSEFVPTVPKCLGANIGRVANFSAFTVLHHTMGYLSNTEECERANTALTLIASGLGLDDQDFIRVAADAVDNYGNV